MIKKIYMREVLKLWLITLVAAFSGLASAYGANNDPDQYSIGVILPLSGSAATLGNYVKNGIELAYNDLSPERKRGLKLYFEDDQLKSRNAVSAFQKLYSSERINAVFVLGSGIGNAVSPIAERKKVITVAIGASDGGIAIGKKYSFTHWVVPEVEAEVMAKELKKRDYKRLAIISTEQEGAIAVYNAVTAALKKHDLLIRIVLDQTFLPDVTDFRTYITKMRAKKVDAVIVLLFPGALGSFARKVREAGLKTDMAGIELFEDSSEVKASNGALIGQWYVNASDGQKWFRRRYKKAFGEIPGWGAANGYDALRIVEEGFFRYGADNDKIAEFMRTLKNYSGAAGTYSATGDNRFALPATIKIVTKDGFKSLYK
ncbi:MAG: amino acid ABC transporter substrate-binding protein [Candidatus Dadabacteria bacterium]|nr:MAG: amino acid ABC transporter substrate-binding protein [Candidatus Dadabacteria bacterium]